MEVAGLESRLAAGLEQIRCLGDQRDTANKAERTARDLVTSLRAAWIAAPDSATMNREREDAENKISNLEDKIRHLEQRSIEDAQEIEEWEDKSEKKEKEIKELKTALKERDTKIETLEKEHEDHIAVEDYQNVKAELDQAQATASKEKQLAAKQATELDLYRTRNDNYESALEHAKAAFENEKKQCKALQKDKEQAKQQHEDLRAELEDVQARLDETSTFNDDLDALQAAQQSLQADFDRQTEVQRELERTIIVKDERIAQLEQQYQRERQRALIAQDAQTDAAVAVVNSPTHDAPPTFIGTGQTLQDQFNDVNAEYTDGGSEVLMEDEHTISDITSISSPPIEPVRPASTIQVSPIAELTPIIPASPKLRSYIDAGTSTTPSDPFAPWLALSEMKGISVEPVEPFELVESPPALDMSDFSMESTAPKEPQQSLTRSMLPDLSLDSPPVAPAQPEAPKLSSGVFHSASTAPISPTTSHTISLTKTMHTQTPYSTPSPTYVASTEASTPSTPLVPTTETAPVPPSPQITKPSKFGWLLWPLAIVAIVLAFCCAYLRGEVNDWRTANGIAFRGSHNKGAYGNGRYLFGLIPVAMNLDDFGIAAFLSNLIASYENPVAYY